MLEKRTGPDRRKITRHLLRASLFGCLVFFAILLSGCTLLNDPEVSQVFHSDQVAAISPGKPVRQTIQLLNPSTTRITVWLQTDVRSTLDVTIQMPSGTHLTRQQLTIHPTDDPQVYAVDFDRLDTTGPVDIQFSVESGQVSLYGRNEDTYAQGDFTVAGTPYPIDAAFELEYQYGLSHFLADLGRFAHYWWVWVSAVILLVLPGWSVLSLSKQTNKLDGIELIGLSIGLSIALIAILYHWASVVGLPITRPVIYAFSGLCILHLAVQSLRYNPQPSSDDQYRAMSNFWLVLIAGIIFAASLLLRLSMIRDLAAPPWVDSIHHGVLTRSIIEQNGLPQEFYGVLPVDARYYHLGYHSLQAAFSIFTGMPLPEAMLIFGQLLNAIAIFGVYLFTKSFINRSSTGLLAMLIIGLFFPLPAYLTSWGRYTHLVGLLLLPALLFWVSRILDKKPGSISAILIAVTLFSGLVLVHYRVAFFTLLLVGIYALVYGHLIPPSRWTWRFLGLSMGFSILILLPWMVPTISNLLIPKAIAWQGGESTLFSGFSWRFLTVATGKYILGVTAFGALLSIFWRRNMLLTVLLWTGALFFSANLGPLGLPDPGFINNLSVEINLFYPIGLLSAYGIDRFRLQWRNLIPGKWNWVFDGSLVAIFIGISVYGASQLLPVLNPITYLARHSDMTAIEWIDANIPEEETVVINSERWGYGLFMGADGGYWISPLSGNPTVPPPVLYSLGSQESVTATNELVEDIQISAENPAALWEIMNQNGIEYIYLGARGGIFSAEVLKGSGLFEVIYNKDGTWVFQRIQHTIDD